LADVLGGEEGCGGRDNRVLPVKVKLIKGD